MAAARVAPPPCEGPIASGEPTVASRPDAVCGTIYQPARRHIDFSVLPLMPLIAQSARSIADTTLQVLLAQFLPDGFYAHGESAGCLTTERPDQGYSAEGRPRAESSRGTGFC
jgi:hypothetical protein